MILHKNLPKFNDSSYVHFATTDTYKNRPYFRDEGFCRILLEELDSYSNRCSFMLMGYVIMPDHVHLLLWWDRGERPELSISKIMQGIKGLTARRIIDLMVASGLEQMLQPTPRMLASTPRVLQPPLRMYPPTPMTPEQSSSQTQHGVESHRRNLRYRLWQRGFYDFNIYSEEKFLEKLNYVHHNPVRAGLVLSPGGYEWSSYRLYSSESKDFLGASVRRLPG
ncbi:MAG: transposase [Dehalococcoidia bacterium]|nr:transposase [Dehalococcoidia bacterium]